VAGAILTEAQEMDCSETDSDSRENLENGGGCGAYEAPKKRWAQQS